VATPAQSIGLVCGFGWARMGALDEFWDLPGRGQPNPISPFGSETQVSVFAGVVEQIDQQFDILPAVLLDLVHATFLPPDQ
jgi:hypothetical protein